MKFLKSRNGMIAVALIAILLIVSGYLLFGRNTTQEIDDKDKIEKSVIQNISPEDLGLLIEANPAGNEIKFSLTKLDNIKSLDYQIQYEADSTAQEIGDGAEPRVDRGIIGEVEVDPSETSYESDWIVLGSESAGTKRYDKGVDEVVLTLKLTKSDGTIYQSEDSLEL